MADASSTKRTGLTRWLPPGLRHLGRQEREQQLGKPDAVTIRRAVSGECVAPMSQERGSVERRNRTLDADVDGSPLTARKDGDS